MVNRSSILKGYINLLRKEFQVTRSLDLDWKGRWNASYRLLETMLLHKTIINKLNSEKHEIGLDYDRLNGNVVKPFIEATKLISGRSYSTIGLSFFAVVQIRDFLDDSNSVHSQSSKLISRLKHLLLIQMEKYFEHDQVQWELIKVRILYSDYHQCYCFAS